MGTSFFRSDCTKKLATLRPDAQFLGIFGYNNVGNGRIADFSIVFHISYHNSLKRSIQILKNYRPSLLDCREFSLDTLIRAREELLDSFDRSIRGVNYCPAAESYDKVVDFYGKPIPGVKLHREQDLLHLYGFVVHVKEISPPIKEKGELMELTRAKKFLRHLAKSNKWVQFRLERDRFKKIGVGNLTITDKECLRQLV